jgi:ferritin-like metal-binding protein YciE
MPQISDPRELFIHELGDMLFAERMLEKQLPTLAEEASSSELRQAFERHVKETKDQIQNLERVFEALGERAKAERCPGIEGIKAEHDQFMEEEDPSPEIRDLFLTGAAARAEHYEIAGYSGLVAMARALGERDAVNLLQENLKQEKEMLKTVETTSKSLLKNSNGKGRSRS